MSMLDGGPTSVVAIISTCSFCTDDGMCKDGRVTSIELSSQRSKEQFAVVPIFRYVIASIYAVDILLHVYAR